MTQQKSINIREQHSSTYRTWRTMVSRCRDKRKRNYYGRVRVDPSWRGRYGFDQFLKDMGPRPSPEHSIDRLGAHYEPGTCRWATSKEQARNRADNHLITVGNRTMTLIEWAESVGVKASTLSMRINTYGWDPVRSISARPRNGGNRTNHPGRGGGRRGRAAQGAGHVGVAA